MSIHSLQELTWQKVLVIAVFWSMLMLIALIGIYGMNYRVYPKESVSHIFNSTNLSTHLNISDTSSILIHNIKPLEYPLLVIGIMTVSRENNIRYLEQTLSAYYDSLNALEDEDKNIANKIIFIIFNSTPNKQHTVFYEMRRKYQQTDKFIFVENPHDRITINESKIQKYNGFTHFHYDVALRKEQQSLDASAIIEYLLNDEILKQTKYFMFGEDDSIIHVNGMKRINQIIQNIHENDFAFLRISYGLNGILFQNKDLDTMRKIFVSLSYELPCDWIIGAYVKQDKHKRKVVDLYDRNDPNKLYKHIGVHSTLQGNWTKDQSNV